jgi:hypothetical protein
MDADFEMIHRLREKTISPLNNFCRLVVYGTYIIERVEFRRHMAVDGKKEKGNRRSDSDSPNDRESKVK